MQFLDILRSNLSGASSHPLADAFDIAPDDARAVTDGVVDELAYAVERNTLSRGGVSDLVEAIGHGGHQKYFQGDADYAAPETKAEGDQLLAQMLGTKHQSRGVAARVGQQTGVNAELIEKMLPAIAAIFMGGVEKQTGNQIGEMAQRFGANTDPVGRQKPLPLPGDKTNYGGSRTSGKSPFDDLSDMIRRGGYSIPGDGRGHGGVNGSNISRKVRDILGNLLGFKSSGLVSWIIRYIVVRYGWRILSALLRRIF